MKKHFRIPSNKTGWWLIATLAVLTVTGHAVIQGLGALPAYTEPTQPAPISPGGVDFASPGGGAVAFSGKLDRKAVLRGGDGLVKMELVLAAEDRSAGDAPRTPTDFVIVLDRSSSMGGSKIVQARTAVRELISQLAEDDRFALVIYSSGAEVAIPLSAATQDVRHHWRQIVAGIQPQGGTEMSAGLDLGRTLANGPSSGRAARLILISDGHANQGDSTLEGLAGRARQVAAQDAVVSAIGVGEGFNEYLMSTVADAGTGNYYYLKDSEQLAQVFSDEFEATRTTVASAVEVSVRTAEGVSVVDAAGYPLERRGARTRFRPGSLFAGQERRIWVTLRVPNTTLGDQQLGTFTLAYRDAGATTPTTRVVEFSKPPIVACVAGEDEYHEAFDRETWARSVAEEDYNHLQQRVASYVNDGRRDEAMKEISEFKAHNERLNLVMQRREIRQKLEDLKKLESEVDDAFEGQNQLHKQKALSKVRQSAGWGGRRIGAKKAPSDKGGQ